MRCGVVGVSAVRCGMSYMKLSVKTHPGQPTSVHDWSRSWSRSGVRGVAIGVGNEVEEKEELELELELE